MATYNGTNLRVFYNEGVDLLIAGEGECSINISHDPRGANTKDSGKWRTSEEGEYSAEVSVSGMVVMPSSGETGKLQSLYSILTSGTPVKISVAINDGGSIDATEWYLYGDFWLTSLEDAGANRETRTYNATFQSTGPLTEVIPV